MADDQDFEKIYSRTAAFEGFFSDHPDDAGGPTKYGISLRFLGNIGLKDGDADGDGRITAQDVDAVTLQKARELMRKNFWDKPGICRLPDLIAMVTFDFAVNAGSRQAVKITQRAIEACTGLKCKADGLIGPVTIGAACTALDGRKLEICRKAIELRRDFYRGIVSHRPRQRVFLKGWLNRCDSLEQFIEKQAGFEQ
ncbi:MAG: glycosyl hydrolase 108 family protein [Desulfovibrionaceae bacterium]|nr:glycosyl hydrolase 108 family protein [Desulfovibrionaceae bacterium]